MDFFRHSYNNYNIICLFFIKRGAGGVLMKEQDKIKDMLSFLPFSNLFISIYEFMKNIF